MPSGSASEIDRRPGPGGPPAAAPRPQAPASSAGSVQRWLGRHGHRIFHPLAGADLGTLARLLMAGPRPDAQGAARLALSLLTSLARLPFDQLDRVQMGDAASIAAVQAPVIIVGHWRSGTTHVHNVLARAPGFATASPLAVGLPWNSLSLRGFLRRRLEECLPPDRLIDAMPVAPDSPQEDELALANMQELSFYHGIFFPHAIERAFARGLFFDGCSAAERARWQGRLALFVAKTARMAHGRRLLLKNPAHSGKLAIIAALMPKARFIHVYRNPFSVGRSTEAMLQTLLAELALERHAHVDIEALVTRTYPRLMSELHGGLATVPPRSAASLRFERFETDPMTELQRLYGELKLDGFTSARPHFSRYLATTRTWRKRPHRFESAWVARHRIAWAAQLARLGYTDPPTP